jgi:hypothetical protein
MRFTLGCRPRANEANPICLYSKTLLNCLPGICRDDAFHLQIKKRSQNFGRVQAGAFHMSSMCIGPSALSSSARWVCRIFLQDGIQRLDE